MNNTDKSIEQWLWDAACSIRGAKDAPKYKDYILPLVFAKHLCDVFADKVNRISQEVSVARPGSVSLDRVAQQYARAVTGIGTDQLWAAHRQQGAATLTGREE